jgi:putative SOS response-associated peptidase YedK
MCARYTLRAPPGLITELFWLTDVPKFDPRYNVAPSQLVPVVGAKPDGRRGRRKWKEKMSRGENGSGVFLRRGENGSGVLCRKP